MSDFNWSAYERWENRKLWENEPEDPCEYCDDDQEVIGECDCKCHWTKEDWEATKADEIFAESVGK